MEGTEPTGIPTPVIDLCAGHAGVYLGCEAAGLPTVAALELDAEACRVLRASGCATVHQGDLRRFGWAAWMLTPAGRRWAAGDDQGRRMFWASPPCQGWSNLGAKVGEADPRNLFPDCFVAVDKLAQLGSPATHVVLENIVSKRLATYLERYVVPQLAERFAWAAVWKLDAADFGVPQRRWRYFTVAGPVARTAPAGVTTGAHVGCATVVGAGWIRNEQVGAKGRPTMLPCSTLGTKGTHYLYLADPGTRRPGHSCRGELRVDPGQAAELQGYPTSWAARVQVTHAVGNAVPPPLAAAVVRAVLGLTTLHGGDMAPPKELRPRAAGNTQGRSNTMAKAKGPVRPFITSIDLTLKRTESRIEGLTPRVIWIGTNGCGKTTWVDGVSLAETGVAEALAGKQRKDAGELFALSPGGALDEIAAEAEHSDGTKSWWGTERKHHKHRDGTTTTSVSKAKPRHAYHPPEFIFPLRELRTAVEDGGVASQRKFFLKAAGSTLTVEAVRAAVESAMQADDSIDAADVTAAMQRYDDASKALSRKGLDAAALLLAATKRAEEEAREAGNRRDGALATTNKATADMSARPDAAALVAAKGALEALRVDLRAVHEELSAHGYSPYIPTADFGVTGRAAKDQLQKLTLRMETAVEVAEDPKGARRTKIMDGLEVITEAHVDKGMEKCLVCNSEVGADALVKRAAVVQERVTAKRAELADNVANRAAFIALDRDHRGAQQAMAKVRKAIPALKQREAIQPEVHAAEAAYEALRTAQAEWKSVDAALELVPLEKAAVAAWTVVATACRVAVKVLLDGLAPGFAERVNRYLPLGWRFGLELFQDGREVCRWGLLRCGTCHGLGLVDGEKCEACAGEGVGDVLHTYTSGGEWAATLAAVAGATVPDSYTGLAILALPDADIHPDVRREVMLALEAFPGQVFVTSTLAPSGRKLGAWTYVEYDGKGGWTVRSGKKAMPPISVAPVVPKAKVAKPAAGAAPPKPKKAPTKTKHLDALEALGFAPNQVGRMTNKTAQELVDAGQTAEGLSILPDGSWVKAVKAETSDEVDADLAALMD